MTHVFIHNEKLRIRLLNQYLLAHAAVFFGERGFGLNARVLGHVVPRPHPDERLEVAPPFEFSGLFRAHGPALRNQGELTGLTQSLVIAFLPAVSMKSDYTYSTIQGCPSGRGLPFVDMKL